MTLLRLAPAAALLALAACGVGENGSDGPVDDADQNGSGGSTTEATVYQGALTVLENATHGPQLAAVTTASYPPMGGALDVANWDWDAVEHTEQGGVLWGSYIVTGTFNGEAFELTEEPIPTEEADMADYPHLEYTEPEIPEPSEDLSESALDAIVTDLTERFPKVVSAGRADAAHGVAVIDTLFVTPEMESYAAQSYPEGTIVFTEVMKPLP